MKIIFLLFVLSLKLFSQQSLPYSGFTYDNSEVPRYSFFWNEEIDNKEAVKKIMQNMSSSEILAQIFLTSWGSDNVTVGLEKWVKRGLGGIKIFGWNVSTLQNLTQTISQLQLLALENNQSIPLVVATDQEGGWVRHIKDKTSFTPGNLAIGATNLPYDAYYSSLYIGEELRNLGVNMNLAPTVDIYENLDSVVIGPRSFSSNPKNVSILSVAYFNGLESNRIISSAKHFPGHGYTSEDSHGIVPVISKTFDELLDFDFLPYRYLIKNSVPTILIGHLNYPQISFDDKPATLSSKVIKNTLRDKLGFDGVLVSDDIFMESLQKYMKSKNWDFPRLVVEIQKAGVNFLLISRLISDEDWDKIFQYFENDKEFREAVLYSCSKILEMKLNYIKPRDRVPLVPSKYDVYQKIPSRMGIEFFENQAIRSATVIYDKDNKIPFNENGSDILVLSSDKDFISSTNDFFKNTKSYKFSYSKLKNEELSEISDIIRLVNESKYVIFNLSNNYSLTILKQLANYKQKIIVISSLTPALIKEAKWVQTAIAVYGWSKNEYRAGMFVLTGKVEPRGILPIDLDS